MSVKYDIDTIFLSHLLWTGWTLQRGLWITSGHFIHTLLRDYVTTFKQHWELTCFF